MKILLAALLLTLAAVPAARASHNQAGQLTYEYVGTAATPNRYRVTMQFFRDCSGDHSSPSYDLECRSGACNGGTIVRATLARLGVPVVGAYYCPAQQANAPCPAATSAPASALANFEQNTYEATVTLPPAADWVLSVQLNTRPKVSNLVGASNTDLRLEARLNNLITPVGGGTPVVVQNSSPQFTTINLAVPFVLVNQSATISFATTDADRFNGGRADSVVYSLDEPLVSCGLSSTYAPAPACTRQILSTTPLCVLDCGPGSPTYSATLPLPVSYDTVGSCPLRLQRPRFVFNARQASFTFTPNRYLNTPSAMGDNKYAVVGKATEYRKINGRYYEVGSVRRDFLIIVVNSSGNLLPGSPTALTGPPRSNVAVNITRDTTDVTVYSCSYTRVRLNFTDPNNLTTPPASPLQNLTIFYPADLATNLLQNGAIGTFAMARNGQPAPALTFYFQPTRAANGTTLLIPLRIEDDACPLKGTQYRTIRVHIADDPQAARAMITPSAGATTANRVTTICDGTSLTFTGSVNRPDSVLVGTPGVAGPQQYAYQWAAVTGPTTSTTTPTPENGLPATTTAGTLLVRPTRTTRYRLAIEPQNGFGRNTCGDTTSFVVRVVPRLTVNFTHDSTSSTPSAGFVPPITFRFADRSTLSGRSPEFRTDSIVWTRQRVSDGHGAAVNGPVIVFARRDSIPSLTLSEAGTYLIILREAVVLAGAGPPVPACSGLAKSRLVTVPYLEQTNVITPNGDYLNETFVVQPAQQGGKLVIYNRWGRKVEEYGSYQNQWSAANQSAGTYFYQLTDTAGNVSKGWLEVIK